jgi:dienelactone hydrolase
MRHRHQQAVRSKRGYWRPAFFSLFCLALLQMVSNLSLSQSRPVMDQQEAMKTFAGLLKIPLEPPEVTVKLTSSAIEEGLLVEDVRWNSLDHEQPAAFVIRPKEANGRLPAIICLHGTGGSRESMTTRTFGVGPWKRFGDDKTHQRLLGWARQLSRQGYLTLSLTQRGLDRRIPDTDNQSKNLLVHGRTLMGAIVYEIRQALSYLQQRPDVDPQRIGVTGLSFGGITAFYTWLTDDRITAAASICGGVGSVETLLQIGHPSYHGYYWWIPGMLEYGDQGDFAAAMAPRPLMLWAPLQDIGMPKEGVERFLERAMPTYQRAGATRSLVVHRPQGEHEFTLEAFKAMTQFFDSQFKLTSGAINEIDPLDSAIGCSISHPSLVGSAVSH